MGNSQAGLPGLLMAACVILAACGEARPNGATASARPTATALATATSRPTVTPSPTVTVTKTPYPPTPEAQKEPIISRVPAAIDPLSTGDDSCQLPCWYGLKVGQSNVEQIQRALRQATGVPEGYVFRAGEHEPSRYYDPGYITFGWEENDVPNSGPLVFSISAIFNPQTDILTSLDVNATPSFITEKVMPPRVIRELGPPTSIWVSGSATELWTYYAFNVIFIYTGGRQPYRISWSMVIPGDLNESSGAYTATWCLNGGGRQRIDSFNFAVSTTFDAEKYYESDGYYHTFQDKFAMSPTVIYDRAVHETNPCIQLHPIQ